MKTGKITLCLSSLFLFFSVALFAQNEDAIPADYDGILVKSDISSTARGGDLEISVTVMDQSIIRYATKEMRDYLEKIKQDYLVNSPNWNPEDSKNPVPFLVNFRALGQEVRYEPHEFVIYCHGQEYKPIEIVPVSPKFNDKVSYIRMPPVSAIYLFDRAIDLNSQDLTFSYFDQLRFGNWLKLIERVNAAKAQYELYRSRSNGK
jgi:hypothetical protein